LHPHHLEALTLRARILRDRGYWNQAKTALESIREIWPENEYALHLLADMHAEAADWKTADCYYSQLEDADPGNFAGLISRCDWLLKHPRSGTENFDDVERLLNGVRSPLNESPYTKSVRARLLLARGKRGRALSDFKCLWSAEFDSRPLRNQLALAYGYLERPATEPQILIDLRHQHSVRSYNTLAKARRLQGKPKEALQPIEESLKLDPENLYTRRAYLALLRELGELKSQRGEAEAAMVKVKEAGLPLAEPPALFFQE
jgi:predicted Zn-dependent protease